MRKNDQLFTPRERRVALFALLAAAAIALTLMAVEGLFRPSLGLYEADLASAGPLPDVVDARPLARL